jgi:glucose-6-phosphate dehydrogenase assembly protein OpcA
VAQTVTNHLGVPVTVSSEIIESELTSLWKAASGAEAERAVIRACSCNLIIIAEDRAEAESLPAVLAELSRSHPSRALVAFRDDEEDAPMRAWISAQCSSAFAGGPQVCSEAIAVAARAEAIGDLPNTLVSLLVPDLPVFLYWRSFRPADQQLVERSAQVADLLIVDSHASKDDAANRERLLELLDHPPASTAVRDLNWSRLTAWRDLVAQFFDAPAARHHLAEIAEVEVCRAIAAPGSIPTRTLLLTGWLATRLGWKRLSAERRGDRWLSRWSSASGEVEVRFTGAEAAGESPGISSLRLRTRAGAEFAVVRDKLSACMTATSAAAGSMLVHSVPQESLDEATLLVRELSLSGGEEQSFRGALSEALALEKSFR